MTIEELYRPLSEIFTPAELALLPQLLTSAAKRYEEYARKANDSERAPNEALVKEHMDEAAGLLELAEQMTAETILEEIKEEWIGEALIKEISQRMSLCKRERFEMYEALHQKIFDLIW